MFLSQKMSPSKGFVSFPFPPYSYLLCFYSQDITMLNHILRLQHMSHSSILKDFCTVKMKPYTVLLLAGRDGVYKPHTGEQWVKEHLHKPTGLKLRSRAAQKVTGSGMEQTSAPGKRCPWLLWPETWENRPDRIYKGENGD